MSIGIDRSTVAPPGSSASIAERRLETPVHRLMSRDYVTVCDNLRLAELAPLFTQRGVGGAPVVDKDGALVGFISRADLSPVGSPSGIVQSAMTPFAFSIDEDTPVSRAAALLAYEGVHRLPVLSFRGALIGMITDAMILRWLARMAGYKLPND